MMILVVLISTTMNKLCAQLPNGFTNELVTDDLYRPLAFTFLPNGQILILEKDGQIKIGGPITSLPISLSTYMTIPGINPSGEHGLIQIAIDPNFESNGYFYLYYSALEENKNRVSRFKDLGDPELRLNSETIIWEATHPFEGCCHTGGTLVFAQDGTLLLATGDDFGNLTAQDMSNSNGKVHRFNTDGSIPNDNPFYDTTPGDFNASGVLKTIYASGLRNPFRGKFDTQLNKLFMGEVGGNNQNFAWEDIHTLELGQGGVNFGWPACGDGSSGRESNGDCTDPAYTDPIYSYAHNGNGAAIIGGVFYRAFQFPIEYQNKYFYGDYVRNWVKYIEFDNNLNAISETTFDNNPGLMLDFEVGPDGNLYYVRVLTAAGSNIGTGEIRRYSFNDPNNTAPECVSINANPISGTTAPLSVDFNATVADVDGDTIHYTWDFGDGNTSSGMVPTSGIIPLITHQYTTKGEKKARLYLTDQIANTACDPITITVGQPPVAQILSPTNNSYFRGNDLITFNGQASDPDGIIDTNNIEWYISFYNGGTIHPRQGPDIGTSTSFTVPTTNHVPFVGNTGYVVSMTVTDSDGLTSTDSIFLQPEKSTITLNSNPSGLTVLLDGIQRTTPYSFDELINFKFELNGANQCLSDHSYTFSSWSDDGEQTHEISVPDINTEYLANYDEFDECIICERAVELSGLNEQLRLVNDVILSGDFTIEFWANLDLNMGSADAPMSNGAQEDINFSLGKARLYTGTFSGSDQIASNFTATPNEWHHYAFVREGTTMKIFVDGLLDKTKTITWGADFIVAKLGVAQSSVGYFDGELDEIRLWNIARNDSEILTFYDKAIEPSTIGLEAYWNFNEEFNSQIITDQTGNGHDAELGISNSVESEDPSIVFSRLINNECAFNYIYDNGWFPSNPNGISMLNNSLIIENGDASINNNTYCNNIIVRPGASVHVESGSTLTLNANMTLESSSVSYSNLILDGSISGNIFYNRHVNNVATPNSTTGGNDLISPPLTGQTFGDFRTANSNLLTGLVDGQQTYLFGPFDNTNINYTNFTLANDSNLLNAGYGYRSGTTDGGTLIFTGNVKTQTVEIPISYGNGSNWNLIGNPYPSYIKALDFLTNSNNSVLMDEHSTGIYGYDGEAQNGWNILNLATTNANTLISPGQGFFIKALSNGMINFTPEMRTVGNTDDFIPGRDLEDLIFFKLKAETETKSYSTDFYFNDNSSLSLDIGYDASIWHDAPPNFCIYSLLVENNNGIPLALQAINTTNLTSVTIPIGINSSATENLTISIEESTLPNTINIYLEDTFKNTVTLLNSESYQISPESDIYGTGRYFLHLNDSSLVLNENDLNTINIYSDFENNSVIINGNLSEVARFNLYDIQGRLVKQLELENNVNQQMVDVSTLENGIYIVELKNSVFKKQQKIIIK